MKVADFQKYLRALADAIATKAPAAELTAAADALEPFAAAKMTEFAVFLQAAAAKYGETGQLPDGKPAKAPPKPRAPKAATTKAPKPTADDLVAAVDALKVRLRTDREFNRAGVEAELQRFNALTIAELLTAAQRLGLRSKPKKKGEVQDLIITYTLAAQSGIERSFA